jgi:hypothetical protein
VALVGAVVNVSDLLEKCRGIVADGGSVHAEVDPDALAVAASVLGHLDADECGWAPEMIAEIVRSPSMGDHVAVSSLEITKPDELRYAARTLLVLAEQLEQEQKK